MSTSNIGLEIGANKPTNRQYFYSYAVDWIVVIVMIIINVIIYYLKPHHRNFSINDATIKFPMKDDTVPFWAAGVISVALPALVVIGFSLFKRRSFFRMQVGLLALAMSHLTTLVITDSLKALVGRNRPDFLSRCKVDMTKVLTIAGGTGSSVSAIPVDPPLGLYSSSICTNTDAAVLKDGMMSFPSGHSSTTFCGMLFLSLFLCAQLSVYNGKTRTAYLFLVFTPIVIAVLVAASRSYDNRHHWQDILGGSIIGVICAWYCYRFYFPSVASAECRNPYNRRFDDGYTNVEERSPKPSIV
ncbi:Lipid phosphate phosphatase 1 [Zancudomyces culisetae]|uniref:Lipid phosphate phosphatase 1 n=1 Tax=Zancudomyces culisetae TaxID=1213189 RepID=A0A1R1PWE3_ZANCU|nr:Lipid phosphate phosphatase 1 [Zancudomyces culisetae]|eukprot:OMH85306.1 Lipid phosphate phosphatase 1 [Zancudomyces culisetae]